MTEPSPRRPGRRLSPLTPVVRAPIVLLAVVGASWQQLLEERNVGLTGLVLLGILVAGAAYGTVSWARTKYWIDADELRIDTGVVVRQSRRIRIDRLQGIDIVQPLVARLFGLAELRFDLASGGTEGKLAFLPRDEAEAVRELLLARRDDLRGSRQASGAATSGPPGGATGPAPAEPPWERVLARLDLRRLVVSLLLSTEMLLGAVALAVLGLSALLVGSVVVAGVGLPAVLGLAITVWSKLSGFYGFTLLESPAGLTVRRGLTSLSSQTVAPVRIQGFVVTQPLLWRPLGWARLEVSVAGSKAGDPGDAKASSTLIPVAPLPEVLAVLRHVMAGRDATLVPVHRTPGRAAWLAPFSSWNLALGQDDVLLVSTRGWWFRRLDVVPHERVQSVQVRQGPLQRRLSLATVRVDSPVGPVEVTGAHREVREARAYLDAAVERSRAARAAVAQPAAVEPNPWLAPPTAETIHQNAP